PFHSSHIYLCLPLIFRFYFFLFSSSFIYLFFLFFFLLLPPPPRSTLFPYTTLFRSLIVRDALGLLHGGNERNDFLGVLGGFVKIDRKSTRLNSSHVSISYAVFCLKKKKKKKKIK